jgi:hypothetical protein
MKWFLDHRPDLASHLQYHHDSHQVVGGQYLLSVPSKEQLLRVLTHLLDENQFLSPYGIRSMSRVHQDYPYVISLGKEEYRVDYAPGESNTSFFGGNSNWRGPVWFPVNYLLIEALERYHHFYGDNLKVPYPTGSTNYVTLRQVALDLSNRLTRIFSRDSSGRRAAHGDEERYRTDPNWNRLNLFYEYFHGDTGKGLGASHQTGWTALITRCFEALAGARK